jgi:hypothetical protein
LISARTLLQAMSGTIALTERPGGGTIVTVMLPVYTSTWFIYFDIIVVCRDKICKSFNPVILLDVYLKRLQFYKEYEYLVYTCHLRDEQYTINLDVLSRKDRFAINFSLF